MKPTYNTRSLIFDLLFSLALLLIIFLSTQCVSPRAAWPVDSPNPLDEPGETEPTAAALHARNIREIQGTAR
jgi:hypothetical protein